MIAATKGNKKPINKYITSYDSRDRFFITEVNIAYKMSVVQIIDDKSKVALRIPSKMQYPDVLSSGKVV